VARLRGPRLCDHGRSEEPDPAPLAEEHGCLALSCFGLADSAESDCYVEPDLGLWTLEGSHQGLAHGLAHLSGAESRCRRVSWLALGEESGQDQTGT
jgi:hypothetical protein